MVTAQRNRYVTSRTSVTALAPALRRDVPIPVIRERAMPRSRRREHQAWMSLLIVASGLLLALGILSLYGRICQTSEINRRGYLNSQLKLAHQRDGELTLSRATSENDTIIAEQAVKFRMIRRTDRDTVTIP